MTAIELTPATISRLDVIARIADVPTLAELAADGGGEPCDWFNAWLEVAARELETEHSRPLAEARLLLDKIGVHLGVVPSMEGDPSGAELLEAARRVSTDRARLDVLDLLARAVERFTSKGGPPRVRVDLFSGGEQLPTVWLDTALRIGEVLDLGIDGVPCCRVVGPLVRRGPGHIEVHVVPHASMSEGGEF